MAVKMGKVGRPSHSVIRNRIQQIIDALGITYGYEIFKVYSDAFEPIDIRSIYYHLNKGIENGEFIETEERLTPGAFTWGGITLRKYYILGPNANEKSTDDLHMVVNTLGFEYKDPNNVLNWDTISKDKLQKFLNEMEGLIKRRGFKRAENQKKLEKLSTKIESTIHLLSNKIDLSPWFELKTNLSKFIE